jgi:hypothetical protein
MICVRIRTVVESSPGTALGALGLGSVVSVPAALSVDIASYKAVA